jgi:hypothetical protein
MCHKACGLQLRLFRLLEEPNSQLSLEPESCHLGDRTEGVHDRGDARQRNSMSADEVRK